MNCRLATKQIACGLMRPALRLMPRGAIRVLTMLGGGRQDDKEWLALSRSYRMFYDHEIGATVIADLRDWGGRWHYYRGRYYDKLNQLIIRSFLTSGGLYIDIGANLGMHTLLASRVVGKTGRVYAVEPNPKSYALLSTHLAINNCNNVVPKHCALSDDTAELELNCPVMHSGTASLRPIGINAAHAEYNVAAVQSYTGDELLNECDRATQTVVKIDVEGWEQKVVNGMSQFLKETLHVVVSMEITPEWLREANGSMDELFAQMTEMGYWLWMPRLEFRSGLFSPLLRFSTNVPDDRGQFDVVFAKGIDVFNPHCG